MNSTTTVLSAENVAKHYAAPGGFVPVLRKVNLAIKEGEFIIITGPSGSGKTTFLNLAGLLDKPSSGRMIFDGEDTTCMNEDQLCEARKHKVGMVFQKFCLLAHRSALENVVFRFRYMGQDTGEVRRKSEDALKAMGLADLAWKPARLLSSGEQQRVAIARAVAVKPRILLADEPTGNLDRPAACAVMECFRQLNRGGITIVMVTHNEALLTYATRHVTCADGNIVGQ